MIRLTIRHSDADVVLLGELLEDDSAGSGQAERLASGRVEPVAVEVVVGAETLLGASGWSQLPMGPLRALVEQEVDGDWQLLADGLVHVAAQDGAPGIIHDALAQTWTCTVVQDASAELTRRLEEIRQIEPLFVSPVSIPCRRVSDDEDIHNTVRNHQWHGLFDYLDKALDDVDCEWLGFDDEGTFGVPVRLGPLATDPVVRVRPFVTDPSSWGGIPAWSGDRLLDVVGSLLAWTLDVRWQGYPSMDLVARASLQLGTPGVDSTLPSNLPAIDDLTDPDRASTTTGRAGERDWAIAYDQSPVIATPGAWSPTAPASYAAQRPALRRERHQRDEEDRWVPANAAVERLPLRLVSADGVVTTASGDWDGYVIHGRPVLDLRQRGVVMAELAQFEGAWRAVLAFWPTGTTVVGPGPLSRYTHALWASNLARLRRVDRSRLIEREVVIDLPTPLEYSDGEDWPRAAIASRGVRLDGTSYLVAGLQRDPASGATSLELIAPTPLASVDVPEGASVGLEAAAEPVDEGVGYHLSLRAALPRGEQIVIPNLVRVAYRDEDEVDPDPDPEQWAGIAVLPLGDHVIGDGQQELVIMVRPLYVDGRVAAWQEVDAVIPPPGEGDGDGGDGPPEPEPEPPGPGNPDIGEDPV